MLPFLQHHDALTPLTSCTTCNKTTITMLSYYTSFNITQPKIRRRQVGHKSATTIFGQPNIIRKIPLASRMAVKNRLGSNVEQQSDSEHVGAWLDEVDASLDIGDRSPEMMTWQCLDLVTAARHYTSMKWQSRLTQITFLCIFRKKILRNDAAAERIPKWCIVQFFGPPISVATNLENLEYSGISLNMENSGNSQGIPCIFWEKL